MKLLPILLSSLIAVQAHARVPGEFGPESKTAPDLSWPKVAVKFEGQMIDNRVFSPTVASAEPLPAIVLMHTCAGITRGNEQTLKMWVLFFTNNGYMVLVPNHLEPRTTGKNCSGKERNVKLGRLVKDAYDAVEHLSRMPGVDKNRIFTFGFSLGGMTGGLAASQSVYEEVAKGRLRPRAVGSMYGGCQYKTTNFLPPDASIPVLWLMGGQDHEAPAKDCMDALKTIKARLPSTQYHVYPDATHAWDSKGLDGFSRVAGNGASVTYRFSEEYTVDSMQRALDFFNSFK